MRLLFLIGFITILTACNRNDSDLTYQHTITCDIENTKNNRFTTSDKKYNLRGARHQTSKESLSGDYSVYTTPENQYSLTFNYSKLFPDQYFHISVWFKGNPQSAVLVADGIGSSFYQATGKPSKDSLGWHRIDLDFHVPPKIEFKDIRIYVWNNGNDTVYFDNLTVHTARKRVYPVFDETALQIFVSPDDMQHLQDLRMEAYNTGYLQTSNESYVKTTLVYGPDTLKGKLRFKGDFFEHLIGNKWSMRIKLKKKYSWNDMNTFSLHSPKTRNFLDEKIIHDFCRDNDILATRYGFVPVMLNGERLGIYAYEEHFRKELVESLNRREGVIVKPTEDEMWFNVILMQKGAIKSNIPYFEASAIVPFQDDKVAGSSHLFNQFEVAQDLVYRFQNGMKPVDEIFDVERMAKYMSIVDIVDGYHGLHWHNLRFYYNPVSVKLEPIAFDNNIGWKKINAPLMARYFNTGELCHKGMLGLFNDEVFVERYLFYLDYYTDNFMELVKPILEQALVYQPLIQKEFPGYQLEMYYQERVAYIKNNFEEYTSYIRDSIPFVENEFKPESDNSYTYHSDIPAYLVKVYTEFDSVKGNIALKVVNHFNKPIELTGYILDGGEAIVLDKSITVPALAAFLLNTNSTKRSEIGVLLFNTHVKSKEQHQVSVFPWTQPDGIISWEKSISGGLDYLHMLSVVSGNSIVFKNRSYQIDQTIIIPQGYRVVFQQGAKVNIVNSAAFISFSPLLMQGNANNPVHILSSDGTAMGFTVMQNKEESRLNHVVFNQLNTLQFKGWQLTGAVNFYQSDVVMNHVSFINNRCEDALNIICSEFVMDHCIFDNVFADAFDSDFSNGTIKNSEFRDIGNDAIDFSGSQVEIMHCKVLAAGDKGISGGENSTLDVDNVQVVNANIGIASKDNSMVKANNISISNCNYGLVVLNKKAVYGPASATLSNTKFINVGDDHLIEESSQVQINGEKIEGTQKGLVKKFYL